MSSADANHNCTSPVKDNIMKEYRIKIAYYISRKVISSITYKIHLRFMVFNYDERLPQEKTIHL